MISSRREAGISESIGFILILAAVIVALSIYLLYMMPAMGRENEIAQMSAVKDSLTEYKLNIDTLWTSRQCTTDFGPALTLGSGETTGILGFFPFLTPVKAGAVLALNQRLENITITSDSYLLAGSGGYTESRATTTTPANVNVNSTPSHLFVNISSADIQSQRGILIDGPGWDVWVNVTPQYSYSRRFNLTVDPTTGGLQSAGFWERDEYLWNSSDITVNTFSGTSPVVSTLAVYRGASAATVYPVDLMNPVYGISSQFQNPQSLWISKSDNTVSGTVLVCYGYAPTVSSTTLPLGSIEYRSNNLYYTPQTYYYQLGGVFLEQDDGSTMEIPPSISLSMVNTSPVVRVGEILLQGSVADADVSGSGPITVTSAVTDIENAPLPTGNNTRWINLTIQASTANASAMWLRTLRDIADRGGLPVTSYTNGSAGNIAFINVTGNPQVYDVQLALTQVNVSADYVEEYTSGGISRSWRSVPGYAAPGYTTSATTAPTTTTTTVTPTATPTPPPGSTPWYDCSWTHRKNITFDKTKVVGTVTDFPVLINLTSDSDLKASARSNGFDIFFTDSDGVTKLSHQIENYNPAYGGLTAWVKVPSLSSAANTSIYMYYGNPASGDQATNPNLVWDAKYSAVYHLNESGSGLAGEFKDSTSNGNNGQGCSGGTWGWATPTRTAAGKMGYGQTLTQAGAQCIGVPNTLSLQASTGLTLEAWENGGSTWGGSVNYTMIGKQYGTKKQDSYVLAGAPGPIAAEYLTSGGTKGGSVVGALWNFIAMNYSSSGTATSYLWLNGAVVSSASGQSIQDNGNPVILGGEYRLLGISEFFEGTLDEVRIATKDLGDAWIETEYNNYYNPSTFYSVRPQESSSCGPAFVQALGTSSLAGNVATITLPGPSTAGNLMVVGITTATQAVTVSSITDSKGNTYNPAIGPTDWNAGAARTWTYYASNIAGGGSATTITITYSGVPPSADTYAAEYSGIATGSPLDQTSAGTGLATIPLDSGSKTTTQASELIFGYGESAGHAIVDPPYTARSTWNNNFIADQMVASINSYHVTATNTAPNNWACQMVTFKGA